MDEDIARRITDAANRYGEDPKTAIAMADIESGGRNISNTSGSGAGGIFQFIPSTWSQYGQGKDRFNVDDNIDAGIRFMRDNRLGLKSSLGRDPTPGEVYLAHQQGLGGATKLLTNPGARASDLVGESAVTGNGGSPDMSAGEFSNKWLGKMDSRVGGGVGLTGSSTRYADLIAPPAENPYGDPLAGSRTPAPRGTANDAINGELQAFGDAYSTGTLVGQWYQNNKLNNFIPDPNFHLDEGTIKSLATNPQTGEQLPPDELKRFYDANSMAHAQWLAGQAWDDIAKRKRLAELGAPHQIALGLLTSLGDPGQLAIGAATAGALNPIESGLAGYFGRAGLVGGRALIGGTTNVAITAALQAQGVQTDPTDYLHALGMGMALGGAFGMAGKNPHTQDLAAGVSEAGHSLMDHANKLAEADQPAAPGAPQRPSRVHAADVPSGFANWSRWVKDTVEDPFNTTPTPSMIDRHARAEAPELFAKTDALDNRIAAARSQIDELTHQSATSSTPLGGRIADLQAQLDTFTGKRRSSPGALALKEQIAQAKASQGAFGAADAATAQSRLDALRTSLNEAINDRARLGTEVKAAHDAATMSARKALEDEMAKRPVTVRPQNPNDLIGPVRYREVTAATDPYAAPPARPGGHTMLEASKPQSVSAAATPDPVTALELHKGDWSDVREKGQFTSNLSVDNARVSRVAFPASGTQLASSPFAESRLAGAFMAGNPVGYKNAANPMSAAGTRKLIKEQTLGRYERFYAPAFNEWADRQGYGQLERRWKAREFTEAIHDYVVGISEHEGAEVDPAVKRFGDQAVRNLYRTFADRIKKSGLGDVGYDNTYLPRILNSKQVDWAYNTFGAETLKNLYRAAAEKMEWAQKLTPEQIEKVATAYSEGAVKRVNDLDETFERAWSGQDHEKLITVLQQDAGMAPEEARGIAEAMTRVSEKDAASHPNLRPRLDLDMNAKVSTVHGDLSLHQLYLKDVHYLTERYTDQMSGRVALAETKWIDPDTGQTLMDGIKSDREFENMLLHMRRSIQDNHLAHATDAEKINLRRWLDDDMANLKFQYDRLLGRSGQGEDALFKAEGGAGQFLQMLRRWAFVRDMGASGWAHMSMFASVLSDGGVRMAMEHLPNLRRMVSEKGEYILKTGLDRDLEAILGNGADPLMSLKMRSWGGEDDHLSLRAQGNSFVNSLNQKLDVGSHLVAIGSGLAHIISLNKHWAAKVIAQKFANMAHEAAVLPDGTIKPSGANMARMMEIGLDEPMLQKVLKEVKANVTTERGIFFDHKVTKLNMHKWDPETSIRFQHALQRHVDRVVQDNDIGSLHRWSGSPIWQMMMQFRNFPMVAQTKQLTYNLAMRDPEALSYFLTTTAAGAMIYIARRKVESIGREDRKEYLENALSMHNIAHAALYHSGWAGMMPTAIDTGLRMAGADPVFDYRTTGNPQAIWSAPGVTNLNDIMTATKAAHRSIMEHRAPSQVEAKQLLSILPGRNLLPATWLTNLAVRPLERRAPPEDRGERGTAPSWLVN